MRGKDTYTTKRLISDSLSDRFLSLAYLKAIKGKPCGGSGLRISRPRKRLSYGGF